MNRIYIFFLLAIVAAQVSANPDSTWVADNAATAANEKLEIKEQIVVQTYPNPFNNELNIRCETAEIKRVEFWSMNNKILLFHSQFDMPIGSEVTINTAGYEQGYYAVKIFLEKETKTVLVSK